MMTSRHAENPNSRDAASATVRAGQTSRAAGTSEQTLRTPGDASRTATARHTLNATEPTIRSKVFSQAPSAKRNETDTSTATRAADASSRTPTSSYWSGTETGTSGTSRAPTSSHWSGTQTGTDGTTRAPTSSDWSGSESSTDETNRAPTSSHWSPTQTGTDGTSRAPTSSHWSDIHTGTEYDTSRAPTSSHWSGTYTGTEYDTICASTSSHWSRTQAGTEYDTSRAPTSSHWSRTRTDSEYDTRDGSGRHAQSDASSSQSSAPHTDQRSVRSSDSSTAAQGTDDTQPLYALPSAKSKDTVHLSQDFTQRSSNPRVFFNEDTYADDESYNPSTRKWPSTLPPNDETDITTSQPTTTTHGRRSREARSQPTTTYGRRSREATSQPTTTYGRRSREASLLSSLFWEDMDETTTRSDLVSQLADRLLEKMNTQRSSAHGSPSRTMTGWESGASRSARSTASTRDELQDKWRALNELDARIREVSQWDAGQIGMVGGSSVTKEIVAMKKNIERQLDHVRMLESKIALERKTNSSAHPNQTASDPMDSMDDVSEIAASDAVSFAALSIDQSLQDSTTRLRNDLFEGKPPTRSTLQNVMTTDEHSGHTDRHCRNSEGRSKRGDRHRRHPDKQGRHSEGQSRCGAKQGTRGTTKSRWSTQRDKAEHVDDQEGDEHVPSFGSWNAPPDVSRTQCGKQRSLAALPPAPRRSCLRDGAAPLHQYDSAETQQTPCGVTTTPAAPSAPRMACGRHHTPDSRETLSQDGPRVDANNALAVMKDALAVMHYEREKLANGNASTSQVSARQHMIKGNASTSQVSGWQQMIIHRIIHHRNTSRPGWKPRCVSPTCVSPRCVSPRTAKCAIPGAHEISRPYSSQTVIHKMCQSCTPRRACSPQGTCSPHGTCSPQGACSPRGTSSPRGTCSPQERSPRMCACVKNSCHAPCMMSACMMPVYPAQTCMASSACLARSDAKARDRQNGRVPSQPPQRSQNVDVKRSSVRNSRRSRTHAAHARKDETHPHRVPSATQTRDGAKSVTDRSPSQSERGSAWQKGDDVSTTSDDVLPLKKLPRGSARRSTVASSPRSTIVMEPYRKVPTAASRDTECTIIPERNAQTSMMPLKPSGYLSYPSRYPPHSSAFVSTPPPHQFAPTPPQNQFTSTPPQNQFTSTPPQRQTWPMSPQNQFTPMPPQSKPAPLPTKNQFASMPPQSQSMSMPPQNQFPSTTPPSQFPSMPPPTQFPSAPPQSQFPSSPQERYSFVRRQESGVPRSESPNSPMSISNSRASISPRNPDPRLTFYSPPLASQFSTTRAGTIQESPARQTGSTHGFYSPQLG